ncbi:MAG: patatin-like phospholipase family protein [Thermoleophilaceae bacterium]
MGAGGVVGRGWMAGVLTGIEELTGWDLRESEAFVGTSAGSIVAATLAAGERPRIPDAVRGAEDDEDVGPEDDRSYLEQLAGIAGRVGIAATRPAAGPLLRAAGPAGAVVRGAMLSRSPSGRMDLSGLARRIERLGVSFDGRLRVVAVDRESGRRTVFGDPDAPAPPVARAVQASCSIPAVFSPVSIDGREYVDGGVWSLTNMDIAPVRRGQKVLCLNPTGRSGLAGASLARMLASWSRARLALEEQYLEGRGVKVSTIGPDRIAGDELGPNLMDQRRTHEGAGAGYRQAQRILQG